MVELQLPEFKVVQARHYAYSTTYDGRCVNEFILLPQYVCTIVNNDIPVNFDMLSFGDSVM
jgi:hypothetical protein